MLTLFHLQKYLFYDKIYDSSNKYFISYKYGNVEIFSSRSLTMDSYTEIKYKVYDRPYKYIRFIIRLGISDVLLKSIYYLNYTMSALNKFVHMADLPNIYYFINMDTLLSYTIQQKKYEYQTYMHYTRTTNNYITLKLYEDKVIECIIRSKHYDIRCVYEQNIIKNISIWNEVNHSIQHFIKV